MYEEEKNYLRTILKKKESERDKYLDLNEAISGWDDSKKHHVYQELKRDYEIGKPIDKMGETFALYLSIFSILISGLSFVFGDGYIKGYNVLVVLCGVLAFLIICWIVFNMWSYNRKRRLKTLIDFFEDIFEDDLLAKKIIWLL